ncbi:MAG: DUF4190 domain-containing protein [Nocardioides sp.]|uniref:hypothetical protein n=1 Tax=Nocardioides sp. TaxID=35761 RepID=UPI0039E37491
MSQYPAPPPVYGPRPSHPQATTVLVVGILGLVLCQILGPVAWAMGNRVVAEIDASGGAMDGRESANAGRICGIVASILLALSLLGLVVFGGLALLSLSS